ncbi:hypothetical protein MRX96_050867 [Rhipicephalus microplus]
MPCPSCNAEPPRVNPFSFLKRWRTGEKTSVTCMVASGTAPMKFIWMKDGKELVETSNVRFKNEQGYSVLLFEPVEVNSGGNYTCVVKNRAGLDSYTTFLDVEAPPKWLETVGDQKMAFESEADLYCRAAGSPPPTIRWERYSESTQSWRKLPAEGEHLEIPRVTLNETGRYRCTSANGVPPEIRHELLLSIFGAPKVLPFSFPNRPKVLGRTSVMCSAADGTQPFTFSWLKDGSSVTDLKNVREKKESDYSVLIIEPVEAVHAGNYTCIVKNKAGFDSHTAYLEVEAPPMWKSVPGNTDVVKGKELVLFCNAHGSPSPKVSWMFKQGKTKEWSSLRNSDEGTSVSPNGTLVLKSAQESQSGEFKCSADNGIGRLISHIFTVKVREISVSLRKIYRVQGNAPGLPPLVFLSAALSFGVFTPSTTAASTNKVPPKIIAFHFRKTIKPGENARTTCLVEAGDAPMTFSWLRNGVDASLTRNVQVNTHADFSILNVSPVDATSAGNFTCIVKNKAGFDSFTAYLDVEVAPKIQPFHFRKTAKPGETVRTSCLVEAGDRPMTFSWLRNGHDASSLANVKIDTHSEVSLLTISPVSASSAGNFTCIVKNKAGFDSFTSLLEVEAPPEWKREPMDKSGTVGSTLHIDCLGSGSPAPRMSWYSTRGDGLQQPVSEALSSRSTVYPNGTLVIHELDVTDRGQYTCTADNGVAPVLKKTITLKINGKRRK